MLSAMHAQRAAVRAVLARCRTLGRRTMIGGPYASSQPEALLAVADHVVAGEVDEQFGAIAAGLEAGLARRLYRVSDKPDLTRTPAPRFDLLRLDDYASMSVQFSRGCPFQCEFCDIITIYGRKPRTKTPEQLVGELDLLHKLGWRKQVFIVDDNFIGNRHAALQLTRKIAAWQRRHESPYILYTETSIDLSGQPELMDAMAEANFLYVFIGIETPSEVSLREARKFQNLRGDTLTQIRTIQRHGLWVTAGFIVGFDADDEGIFERQTEFIEQSRNSVGDDGSPAGAPHDSAPRAAGTRGSPLRGHRRDDQLHSAELPDDAAAGDVAGWTAADAARVVQAQRVLSPRGPVTRVAGSRARHSMRLVLRCWTCARLLVTSVWCQGVLSSYRREYWRFLLILLRRWHGDRVRLWKACLLLLSAHHFLQYARQHRGRPR